MYCIHTHRVLLRYGCVNIYTNVVQSFYGLQHFTSRKSVHLHENLCSHLYIYIYYWGVGLRFIGYPIKKKLPNKTTLLAEVIYSPYKPKYIFLMENIIIVIGIQLKRLTNWVKWSILFINLSISFLLTNVDTTQQFIY